jgi:hypothetical protein
MVWPKGQPRHERIGLSRTLAISGPRPLTKLQPADGIAGPLHRVVMAFTGKTSR